jgi:hypothetical protein
VDGTLPEADDKGTIRAVRPTRRAEYAETCSLGSTEATQSNPAGFVSQPSNPEFLSDCEARMRATRTNLDEIIHQGRRGSKRVRGPWTANPVRGTRALLGRVRVTRLAWGVIVGRPTIPGGLARRSRDIKSATMKSSTMKGSQELASESNERRCQTAKTQRRRVGECFYVRFPEIALRAVARGRKLWRPGGRTYDVGVIGSVPIAT